MPLCAQPPWALVLAAVRNGRPAVIATPTPWNLTYRNFWWYMTYRNVKL